MKCYKCKFHTNGRCHKKAPIGVFKRYRGNSEGGYIHGEFPIVDNDDFCGDFEERG